MSKRMDYFAKACPEAAGLYLSFLKEAGKGLDDKTRFLISVINKVITDTPSGLRQYIPHALRAGASGREVVDAIMMSFPAAGLTRILNAFEIIQEMDLPELRLENLDKKPEWYTVGPIEDIPVEALTAKTINGKDILIYRTPDKINVFDRTCPHLGNRLPAKSDGTKLTCKSHNWSFDLESGKCIATGTRDLHLIPHRVEKDTLEVELICYE